MTVQARPALSVTFMRPVRLLTRPCLKLSLHGAAAPARRSLATRSAAVVSLGLLVAPVLLVTATAALPAPGATVAPDGCTRTTLTGPCVPAGTGVVTGTGGLPAGGGPGPLPLGAPVAAWVSWSTGTRWWGGAGSCTADGALDPGGAAP